MRTMSWVPSMALPAPAVALPFIWRIMRRLSMLSRLVMVTLSLEATCTTQPKKNRFQAIQPAELMRMRLMHQQERQHIEQPVMWCATPAVPRSRTLLGENTPIAVMNAATKPATMRVATQPQNTCASAKAQQCVSRDQNWLDVSRSAQRYLVYATCKALALLRCRRRRPRETEHHASGAQQLQPTLAPSLQLTPLEPSNRPMPRRAPHRTWVVDTGRPAQTMHRHGNLPTASPRHHHQVASEQPPGVGDQ